MADRPADPAAVSSMDRLRALQGSAPAVIAMLLVLIFVGETLVMGALEAWLPKEHNFWVEALIDAAVLTLICTPFVVFVVRRLRRRSRLALRALDIARDGYMVVDVRGRILDVNVGYAGMSGYTRAELLGMHINDLDALETPATTRARIAQVMATGYARFDTRHRHRDGSLLDVNVTSTWLVDLQCFVTFVHDISERLRVHAALARTERRASDLIDSAMDAIISIDADQRIVLFNRAAEQVFGISAEAALGSPLERFVPVAARERHRSHVAAYAAHGHTGRLKGTIQPLTGLRADGREFPVEASISRIETDAGPLMTVMLRDVTELQAAREEHAAHQARSGFLSRMSHELRTPLNAVLGFSQLLRQDTQAPLSASQRGHAERIQQAGEHLLALVNDVLDLSRIESGQIQVLLEPLNAAALADEALGMLAGLAHAHQVTLRLAEDGHAAPPWVQADRLRLKQVLLNLLSNAIKYNRAGGDVVLGWQQEGAHCRLRIADTGRGMSPEQLAHLFEPFNRLGAERSPVDGTGIGLVVARGLAELMQGRLSVDSTVGHGTVVTLTLPGSAPPASVPAPALAWRPSRHAPLEGSLHVLYAEDNEVNVELVRAIVGLRPGVTLHVAPTGAQALALARRDPPDLLLLDMHLGDMTGLEVAQALQADPVTADIPLVALSADALPQQIATAMAHGCVAYLTKPIDFGALLRLLDDAAAG
jgi:PAS domain S-box-containing protein